MQIKIKNGTGEIKFLKENKMTKEKLKIIFDLLSISVGTRVALNIIDPEIIDSIDPTEAFIKDHNGNLIINSGTYVDLNITYNTYMYYSNNSFVLGLFFSVPNKNIDGTIILNNNNVILKKIYPDEIDTSNIDENIDISFEY